MSGRAEGEEDVLSSFQEVASSLQDGLDGYERMRLQIDHAVASLGKVALVGKRLAENISSQNQWPFHTPSVMKLTRLKPQR